MRSSPSSRTNICGPLELEAASATIAELRGTEAPAVPPPQYIFHSAFAASTLLARALDVPGVAMGLKEPAILNELAEAMRSNALPRDALASDRRVAGAAVRER